MKYMFMYHVPNSRKCNLFAFQDLESLKSMNMFPIATRTCSKKNEAEDHVKLHELQKQNEQLP